jgi:alkanesulfonate monooxygenase SsuD/methylene tetrahydromethanopterin reductase-like flavin-dependent oxidoreductase (luciferase family)
MVVGRGSFIESFPLFGLDTSDYDKLFIEKLDLLLKIREKTQITWSGQFRPALQNQFIYPRPLQETIPIWVGVGGTPASFVRAGILGLPLMVAIIGGETHRFRPYVDLYREAGAKAGHAPDKLQVGLHSLGYVSHTRIQALDEFFPGYAKTFTEIGKERGWPPVTRQHFEAQTGPLGALLVGDPDEIAERIIRHSEALGGISRLSFQMDNAHLPQEKLLESIELIGTKVAPLVRMHNKSM